MSNSTFTLTAVFESVEHGWVQARIVEIPGVITAAPSRTEAEELLIDALREYLLALGETNGDEAVSAGGEAVEMRIAVGL